LGKAIFDRLGSGVSSAGDINGDGFDDIIVGAQNNNDGGSDDEGAVYIFFGSATLSGTKSLGAAESADVTILGKATRDRLGISVSSAGDVNGDGLDDIILGAYQNDDGAASYSGAAYIFFGASNLSGTKSLGGGQSADVTILGKAANDRLGKSVSGAGDVNGDGFDDIIVAAYQNDDGGSNAEGAAYIFFGASNLSGTKDTGNADEDVRILGKAASDQLGYDVSGAGDVNGDGIDDVIVGAVANDDAANQAGSAYIIFGSTTLSGTKDTGTADEDVRFLGKAATNYLGVSVSSVGDVNSDGISDIIMGAYGNSDGASTAGAAYIFFGSATLSGTKSLGGGQSADVTILGKAAMDELGYTVGGGRSNPGP